MDRKLRMNILSEEELASVTGGVGTMGDDNEEYERCKADCERRLANVAEIIRMKCITNCRNMYKKQDEF